jgi:SAM-dependent methyltransferase
MATETPLASSFRDPAGRVIVLRDRVLRVVNAAGLRDIEALFQSPVARQFLSAGALVPTRVLAQPEVRDLQEPGGPLARSASELVLEHERLPFPSYPYEWPPEMLYQAALLTLDLALAFLPENIGLKDATPYNVLFRGTNPVFVDMLSFEQRDARDPSWVPYAQFVRTFLNPLLANRCFGVGLDQLLLSRRDGLEPDELYRWASPLQRFRAPFLSLVSIPTWLGKRRDQDDSSIYRQRLTDSPEKAAFILESILKGLRRQVSKAAPTAGRTSTWSAYLASNNNYSSEHFTAKQAFVDAALAQHRPLRVLDIGCNTGLFSASAARSGASVVAIDSDPVVVGETWRRARTDALDILPLVVNLTRPTPAAGWRNREFPSFLQRASGSFDMVMMLAVLHHMLVTERIPLEEIADLAAELTTQTLIIEFIGPEDSMFKRLTRGRDHLFRDLTTASFEAAFGKYFAVERREHQPGTFRWLYALRKRA